ncbi:MAG: excinuclease ABC subunit UvrA [Pseudomonadota bacterium]
MRSNGQGRDRAIVVRGAREHNLQNIDVEIPRDRLVVVTGLSGSGKSSLVFDTIYAEGQRRYVESLSAYARQFLAQMEKPDVDSIEGLSPAISIEQKTTSKNPRSTVGTVTEVYDYLRLLFARCGVPHCFECGKPIEQQTSSQIVDHVLEWGDGARINVLAPIARGKKGEYKKELDRLRKDGFVRVAIDGELRELGDDIVLDKRKKHDIDVYVDRLVLKPGVRPRLADAVELALKLGEGLCKILPQDGEAVLMSESFACADCGVSYPEISPRLFSFNNPHGACPECTGLGHTLHFDVERVVPDPELSIADGAIRPWSSQLSSMSFQMIEAVAEHYKFRVDVPWRKLSERAQRLVLLGSDDPIRFKVGSGSMKHSFTRTFEGVIPNLERRHRETQSEMMREEFERYMSHKPCATCGGQRLKREALHVKIQDLHINQVAAMPIKRARAWFAGLELSERQRLIAQRILKEIDDRLGFLVAVGLDYLTLDRAAGSLSGGEAQRIRLATQIGSALVGVLYVLDEPSIGLHQRDNARLLGTLTRLRDLGNSVLVVEHDAETIEAADHVLDLGPGAGRHGGQVVCAGTPDEIRACPDSLTGQYLSGLRRIEVPRRRRRGHGTELRVEGARGNNLKNLDVSFPLGTLVCVTGVSGSGKSTLVNDTLYRALAQHLYQARDKPSPLEGLKGLQHVDKVIDIDQSPIGRTPRSNPATYTGLFQPIRDLFAALPDAKVRGYKPGRFSFNVKGGRCEACEGAGLVRIEMHFLPDVFVTCDVCHGTRYNPETREVRFKGKNISEVLALTVDEALEFLAAIPPIRRKLETLVDVGLGYIQLGQSATTLSGGEAQRIKLSKELSKRATGRTVYILDEPTTGLHFDDVRRLLEVLHRLADAGNSVIVIEHNLDVIKTADWIVDLGPEGGDDGGQIVAEGTPEHIAAQEHSYTGQWLRKVLPRPATVRDSVSRTSAAV